MLSEWRRGQNEERSFGKLENPQQFPTCGFDFLINCKISGKRGLEMRGERSWPIILRGYQAQGRHPGSHAQINSLCSQ